MPAFRRLKLRPGLTVGDWTVLDDGKLADEVWVATNNSGVVGVLKTARSSHDPSRSRFIHEVKVMTKLQGIAGVLRVLDQDPGPEPGWMVTERAATLVDHLGPAADFRSVVSAFADLADALVEAAAADPPIAHRDIKPANLFYGRGRAVLGDFGLATGHDFGDITMEGVKVGPANFCAPETLIWKPDTDPFAADVFCFAKSLWAIAAGETYPPLGQLLIRLREVDLAEFGGRPAEDLARLLELATATRPTDRPSMEAMRDELRTWLTLYPPGLTPRPTKGGSRPSIFDELQTVGALERRGLDKVVDRAVHLVLDGCAATCGRLHRR